MRDLSAGIMGLLPALLLWRLGALEQYAPPFFIAGLATIILSLVIYYILLRVQHGAVLTLLTLGFPLMFYVYVAVAHPVFLPLFYGVIILVVLAGLAGAMVTGKWSWSEIARNIAFFLSALLLVVEIGRRIDLVYIEAGLLAAGAFGITRICEMDLLSWLLSAPRWVYKGLEKIWD